jgi:hypothetical protein
MKFGNEFWLILFREYISPKLFAVQEGCRTYQQRMRHQSGWNEQSIWKWWAINLERMSHSSGNDESSIWKRWAINLEKRWAINLEGGIDEPSITMSHQSGKLSLFHKGHGASRLHRPWHVSPGISPFYLRLEIAAHGSHGAGLLPGNLRAGPGNLPRLPEAGNSCPRKPWCWPPPWGPDSWAREPGCPSQTYLSWGPVLKKEHCPE